MVMGFFLWVLFWDVVWGGIWEVEMVGERDV